MNDFIEKNNLGLLPQNRFKKTCWAGRGLLSAPENEFKIMINLKGWLGVDINQDV